MSFAQHSHPEKEERTEVSPGPFAGTALVEPKRWGKNFEPSHIADIEKLIKIQQQLGLDNKPFVSGSNVHDSTWVKIRNGSYTGRVGTQVEMLKAHVNQLLKQREISSGRAGTRSNRYIEFTEFLALREAVNIMMESADVGSENKVTLYVGHYGAGKTAAGKRLREEGFKTWLVDCLPSFHRSYFAALQEIAKQLGMDDKFRSANNAESEVLRYLKKHKGVLVFNELEALHNDVWTLMRCIVNTTACSIVLLLSPETHRKLQRFGSEAVAQLLRRTEAVIYIEQLTAARVMKFLYARKWVPADDLKSASPEMRHVAEQLATEANSFGAFDCVSRVLDMVAEEHAGSQGQPPADLFIKKLNAYRQKTPVPSSVQKRAA